MKNTVAKKQGFLSLKIIVAVFSVVWLFLVQVMSVTESYDNKWSDARRQFPKNLSVLFTSAEDFTFSFGKYINKPADEKITISAIDDHTVGKYGFPFKRKYYGLLIDRLNKLGVKAIGVDVMFFEPDRDDPSNDERFLASVSRAGNVVNLFAIDNSNLKITKPIPGLASRSAYVAYPNSDISLSGDGYARNFYLFYPERDTDDDGLDDTTVTYGRLGLGKLRCSPACDEGKISSLGMATYAVYTGRPLVEYEMAYGQSPMALNYRYPVFRPAHPGWKKPSGEKIWSTYRHISVADIIEDKLSAEEKESLKGGMTLVGSTALGTYDHFPSPFSTLFPGVEIHATSMDNVKFRDSLKSISALYIAMVLLLLPWIPVYLNRYSITAVASVSLLVVAVLSACDYLLVCNLYRLPFIAVALAFILPAVYVITSKGLSEGREKKWIKNTFGQYLSPKVVEVITKDPSKLALGGEKRDMTAFFLDIAGFTTMSEKMTPEQLTTMLNNYLSGLTDVILRHDGVVDKYIGDCIMAFWNAPLDQKDHRKLACLAAVDCMDEIARLNRELTEFEIKPSARIGLNSGPMVVGNMGSRTRLSYTVMGDSVNLASRLEGANKFFHSKIMVSEYTYDEAKDAVDARMLGQIRVVGKAIPVKVYEPLARKGRLTAEAAKLLAAYNEGYEAFYKGSFAAARKSFEAALAVSPADGPSKFYLDLAVKYAEAVPGSWDGTFNLTSK
ncbi:MAG TPA: adenylate/guanylate cyclase domain-containing protein [Elusimicrobiales bacterium]|nr:adenylate/guanylate cyclase domain-containing protein [Elusimicrobiales bacterium]